MNRHDNLSARIPSRCDFRENILRSNGVGIDINKLTSYENTLFNDSRSHVSRGRAGLLLLTFVLLLVQSNFTMGKVHSCYGFIWFLLQFRLWKLLLLHR